MSLIMKALATTLFGFMLIGCGATQYKSGDYFFASIFASGSDPHYKKEGTYLNSDFYVVTPKKQQIELQAGLLVRNERVIQPLTQEDVSRIRAILAEQAKVVQERNKIESDKKIALQKLEKEKNDKIVNDTNKIIKDMNLKIIYQSSNFYICKTSKNSLVYISEGKVKRADEVRNEIAGYDSYNAMIKNQEENKKANMARSWTVVAGPPEGKNYANCNVTQVSSGQRNSDGSVTFTISHKCWRGTSGTSGASQITCGFGHQNYYRSTVYSAQCR